MTNPELSAVEVIGLGIRSEENSARYYESIARIIKNDLVSARFQSLALEEKGHRNMLVSLYKKMTGLDEPPPSIPGDPDTAEGKATPVAPSPDSLEECLLVAISREKEASEFYSKAAAKSSDPSGKRILEYLADIENTHEMILKKELGALHRDLHWYSVNPGFHVGP